MSYQKASGFDATWLHLEAEDVPLHVASCPIFQLDEGTDPDTFFEEVKQLVRERAPHLRNYRQRRINTPFNLDHPVWHDDVRNIDVDYHVRRTQLPKPGSLEQLEQACARIAAAPMDLNRPLWEYHLIEGIQGNRVALFIKIHHAVIDGELGVLQLDLMLDSTKEPKRLPAVTPDENDAAPSSWDLLGEAVVALVRQPFRMLEALPGMIEAAAKYSNIMLDRVTNGTQVVRQAPPTPFNRSVSRTRRVAFASVPLDELKEIKSALGVTLNDVVMAISGGALRRYLKRRGANMNDDLLAMIPVSLRKDSPDSSEEANLVTGMVCSLGTDIDDPVERAHAVNRNSKESKAEVEATKGALIQNFNIAGAPIALQLASRAYGALRLADFHRPTVNLTLSNVAGPRHDIYLNGAQMLHYHPVSAVVHGQGLNITVQSYKNSLDFGLIACAKLIPDLALMRDDLLDAYRALRKAALGNKSTRIAAPTDVTDLSKKRAKKALAKKASAVAETAARQAA